MYHPGMATSSWGPTSAANGSTPYLWLLLTFDLICQRLLRQQVEILSSAAANSSYEYKSIDFRIICSRYWTLSTWMLPLTLNHIIHLHMRDLKSLGSGVEEYSRDRSTILLRLLAYYSPNFEQDLHSLLQCHRNLVWCSLKNDYPKVLTAFRSTKIVHSNHQFCRISSKVAQSLPEPTTKVI